MTGTRLRHIVVLAVAFALASVGTATGEQQRSDRVNDRQWKNLVKRIDTRWVAALLAPGLLLALFALGGGAAFWATLGEPQRQVLGAALNQSGMVLMLVGLGLWALGAWGANLLYQRHVAAAARLLEQAQVRVDGEPLDPEPFLKGAKLPTELDAEDLVRDRQPR